jgi:hypothetical protein
MRIGTEFSHSHPNLVLLTMTRERASFSLGMSLMSLGCNSGLWGQNHEEKPSGITACAMATTVRSLTDNADFLSAHA